jgi:uncharacterized protein (DUF1800 family)
MNKPRASLLASWLPLLTLATLSATATAAIDLNADGLGDIWALKYSAAALVQGTDPDGDGKTNAEESAAGTDPFLAASRIAISSMTTGGAAGPGVHITWSTVSGKGYQVQSTGSLVNPNWQPETPNTIIPGTGEAITRTYPVPATNGKYYRILVQDLDSDSDGVSDWEELAVRSNPNSNHSAGLSEEDDLTRITNALSAPNRVSIQAIDPDASEVGPDTGTFAVVRSGGLGPITITYAVAGTATPGSDFAALSGSVTLGLADNSTAIVITPLSDDRLESPETVLLTISSSGAYTVQGTPLAAVLIGDVTAINPANVGGLAAQYYNETSTTLSDTNPPDWTAMKLSRVDSTVNFDYAVAPWPGSGVNPTYFASRWSGEVLPQYSQIYTFFLRTNKGGRIWVDGELLVDNWPRANYSVVSTEHGGTISLVGGVRYSIYIEHFESTGNNAQAVLSWQSQNQVKQVIPQSRLFANTPPQITSPTEITLLRGSGPYTYQIAASGLPSSYGAANLPNGPPAWTINPASGQITGTPSQAGIWQIPITATNPHGSGSAILTLTVVETGGGITREVWNGTFNSVADLPIDTQPATRGVVSSLEVAQSEFDTFGSRLRGFITAPVSGAYQFWLTADDQAELWISDDEEVVNLLKRAATTAATGYRAWTHPSAGKSPLLWLEAGKRYYVEVRHVEASGTDHVSVGWFKPGDPGQASAPTEVVPGYALSPWSPPSGTTENGTLYLANLTPQGTAVSNGYGLSTLRLSADESTAYVSASYGNLTTPFSGMHVHDDRLPNGANIVFDPDEPGVQTLPDGSWAWPIVGVAGLSAQQIALGIKNGNTYFNVHSLRHPGGEIKGFYRVQDGSQTFTPPASPPSWSSEPLNANAASRFLTQATFGPTLAEIAAVQSIGYEGWIEAQFGKPATRHLDHVMLKRNLTDPNGPTYPTNLTTNSWWKNSITADDQLRQRIAFALSQILVVSSAGPLEDRSDALSYFYDTLLDHSFGNFSDILKAVTLTPAMGAYLDMRRNDKPNKASGRIPNENYAREILQLFSLGLNRMHPDGSLILNSKGVPVPTYDQEVIVGFAHAFTGWDYNQPNASTGFLPTGFNASPYVNTYTRPMKEVPERHFTGPKRILNNVVLPGLASVGGVALDPFANHTASPYSRTATINDPAYQGLPAAELEATHRAIFEHPNVGPFICRQLIQRLVTSTPSRGYIYRVVQKFDDDGTTNRIRGNMRAVIKAILLDYEARSTALLVQQGYGKQREPLLRVTALARAFPAAPAIDGTYLQTNNVITISNTSVPHKLSSGNAVNLTFTSGSPSPTGRTYSVTGTPASANSFNVTAPDILSCTYAQTGTTITVTRNAHGLVSGNSVYLDFTSGSGSDGLYKLTGATTNTFTVESATSATNPGGSTGWLVFYTGGYTQAGNTITVTTSYNHCLISGVNVALDFSPVTGSTNVALDGTYAVTVLDDRRFTLTATDSVTRSGEVVVGPPTVSLNRSGNVGGTANNWTLNSTDTYLGQTPLRSPTVFNFFEPDYRFPGLLAEAGLITPEFQITSDTNVVRQSNFIFGGIFSSGSSSTSGSTTGLNSFRDGNGSIAIDLSPWMGNRPSTSLAWTHASNLSSLVDELSTLLLAGQLPSTGTNNYTSNPRVVVNAKQLLVDYANTLTDANATVQARNRIRAILHLLATSPQFTIQK